MNIEEAVVESGSREIRQFLRGGSTMRLSSNSLDWTAINLERHVAPPVDLADRTIDRILLILWQGNSVARGEHLGSHGFFVPYAKRPGTLTLFAPGAVPPVRTSTKSDLLLCALDKAFFDKVGDEIREERKAGVSVSGGGITLDEPNFYDGPLSQLALLLRDEVRTGGLSGALYAEHLTHALTIRLIRLTNRHEKGSGRHLSERLELKILSRIIERIETNPLLHFDLAGIAEEAGYSYSAFVRAFRARTGFSPHRYITRLRLDRAKRLMSKPSLTLLEIALETGFASHAHLSHAFRQHFGSSPSQYRDAL